MGSIARTAPLAQQDGFTYLGLLVAIVVIGLTGASIADAWLTAAWREKEQELFIARDQMQASLNQYYASTLFQPLFLDEMALDPRTPGRQRYLRRFQVDPISGRMEWGVMPGAGGAVQGRHPNRKQAARASLVLP